MKVILATFFFFLSKGIYSQDCLDSSKFSGYNLEFAIPCHWEKRTHPADMYIYKDADTAYGFVSSVADLGVEPTVDELANPENKNRMAEILKESYGNVKVISSSIINNGSSKGIEFVLGGQDEGIFIYTYVTALFAEKKIIQVGFFTVGATDIIAKESFASHIDYFHQLVSKVRIRKL